MDINYDVDQTQPPYYMENVCQHTCFNANDVKTEAINAIQSLHGWCSDEKASILIDIILNAKPTTIVEIGVFGGRSLIPMAYAVKANQEGMVYGIDPWSSEESIQGMEDANKEWWGSVDHLKIYDSLVNKINEYNLNDYISLIMNTSLGADPIENIDLLHIDGNHSEETSYIDVTKWVPLVKSGGIIIFDDLNWNTTGKAVEWLNANCIKEVEIVGDNIWGIWTKP